MQRFIIKATCECGNIGCPGVKYMNGEGSVLTIGAAQKFNLYSDAQEQIENNYLLKCKEKGVTDVTFQIEKIFTN